MITKWLSGGSIPPLSLSVCNPLFGELIMSRKYKEYWITVPYRENKPGERWSIQRRRKRKNDFSIDEFLQKDGTWFDIYNDNTAEFRTKEEAKKFATQHCGPSFEWIEE